MVAQNLTGELAVLDSADLQSLMEQAKGPCVSIYMPTSSFPNEADMNRIQFKNHLRSVADALEMGDQASAAASDLLGPLWQLMDDAGFWSRQQAGLVVFRSPQRLVIRRLLSAVPDVAVVADSFHVKPLIRIVQESTRYQVLCVSNERVALYEGVGDRRLTQVPLHPDVPGNMAAALGEPSRVTKTRRSIYDQGETDPRDAQLQRYFRRIDQAVWNHHSRRSNLPLILAALPEYHGHFHEASHNPLLAEYGVRRDPFKDMDEKLLAKLAWEAAQPVRHQHLARLREQFGNARAHDQASDRLEELGRLAAFGKLQTLLLQENRHEGGVIDAGTGEVTRKPMSDPAVDDVLDDLAVMTFQQGGEVLVVPADQMPTNTGVAGISRY